ncbi:MAG: hypothetical protein IKB35_05240, partial [Clostridia bacterium]|nr:hypothetical protein [Clostridia bacterium]
MKTQKNGKFAIITASAISTLLAVVMAFFGCSQAGIAPATDAPTALPITDPLTDPVTDPVTEPVTEPVIEISRVEAALLAAENIKNIGVGPLPSGEELTYDYPYIDRLSGEGYEISHKNFSSETVIAKLSLDFGVPYKKDGYTCSALEFSFVTDSHNALPRGTSEIVKKTHSGIRLYMGFIIADDGTVQTIYTSRGVRIYEGASDSLFEALTRDTDGNPLFYMTEKGVAEYYYFNENNELTLSTHTKADDRGLYFDYNEDYGRSDNGLNRYHSMELIETVVTEEV